MTPGNGISAIIYDLDGTLRYNHPSSAHFFLDYAVSLGLEDSMENRRQAIRWTHYYWAQSLEMRSDLQAYPDEREFWSHYSSLFLKAYGCTDEQADDLGPKIHEFMLENHKPENCVPDEVHKILRKLKRDGYLLAVVSNRTKPCHEELVALGLDQYFLFSLVAGEVSSWKPEAEIFHQALQRLEISPHQAMYVGDNFYADVVGARGAGLHPVLLDFEGIFPDADCPVITNHLQLWELIK